jgi:hypothetical protein
LRLAWILGNKRPSFKFAAFLPLGSLATDEVDESMALEASPFDFDLRNDSDLEVLISEVLSSDDVPSKEIIAIFWP